MPYKLVKSGSGFKVSGPSGAHYSKKPQSKERALSQMRALYVHEFGSGSKSGKDAS